MNDLIVPTPTLPYRTQTGGAWDRVHVELPSDGRLRIYGYGGLFDPDSRPHLAAAILAGQDRYVVVDLPGIVALIRSLSPDYSPEDVADALDQAARPAAKPRYSEADVRAARAYVADAIGGIDEDRVADLADGFLDALAAARAGDQR